MDVHKNVPLTPLGREAMVRRVNIDIKKFFRFSRTGHRITGERKGQSRTRGVGWGA